MPEINGLSILSNALAYYRFESGSNTSDSSGNSNTLTHVNTPTNPTGQFGSGMDYELSSSQYSYAVDSVSISPTGDISISAWVKLEQLPSTAGADFMIVAKWNFSNNKRSYRFSISSANKLDCRISDTGSTQTTRLTAGAVFSASDVGNWVHVAMTVDVSGTLLQAYKNGIKLKMDTVSGTATSIHDNNARMAIGAQDVESTPAQFFDGVVDDVAIFNKCLTDAEVKNIYDGNIYSVTLNASACTHIESNNPTTNYNGNAFITVGEWSGGSQLDRGLLDFDVEGFISGFNVPSNAVITALTLRLYDEGLNYSSTTRTLRAYRLLREFVASQTTWNIAQTAVNWGTAGCANTTTDREASDVGSVSMPATEVTQYYDISISLSTLQEVIDGLFTFRGFLIKMDTETNDMHQFSDDLDLNPPQLVITYTVPSASMFLMF